MATVPALALLDFLQPFQVETNALGTRIRAILMQGGRPIAYFTQALSSKAILSLVYEKELMAIILADKKWHSYLVVIDHLTNFSHFIPLCHPYTVKEVAAIFIKEVMITWVS